MKTGLVLEGGALRGMFTAGVLDVLSEQGICVDGVIGVSAGACFGCNYKSGQVGRAVRYNARFARDRRYCSVWSWLTTGNLFNAEFAYHTVAEEIDVFDNQAFLANPMEYYLVATDVLTGGPVYQQMNRGGAWLYEWLRASSSMPIVSKVVEIDGYKLLDGGISDSIPLQYFESLGYERNVVILTQPLGFKKKKMGAAARLLMKTALRKYPKLVEALENRWQMYNAELDYVAQRAESGDCLVIAPDDVLPIGRISHDAEKMWKTHGIGRKIAEERLEEIRGFLRKEE